LDAALKDLDMGQGNNYLSMRATMLDARGQVRKDLYKPNGDVHLNSSGTKIASLRIRNMLEIMLPHLAPVQAPVAVPVVVNPPPVVNVPLVAAGVQQLVGQIQDLVVQNVTIVQPPVAMEVEGDNETLKRLFLKRFGRELPEKEKDDVDINFVIDLTDGPDEMEVATSDVDPVVVKKETIEVAEAPEIDTNPNAPTIANVAEARKERKAFNQFNKSAKFFAKKLAKEKPNPKVIRVRKIRIAEGVDQVIPEKEAPNDSADPNTTEAEFEKDLIGIYAGPIGKVQDVAKENDAQDESMDDAPPKDVSPKDVSSKDV
jgi:hypothetical protein